MPPKKMAVQTSKSVPGGRTQNQQITQRVDLAIVHHANQFMITNGYLNREGLNETAGSQDAKNGYLNILGLHQQYRVPFNLHVSGTLLESLVWYRPDVVSALRDLREQGLLELIGSCYAQNVMRFFSHEHNLRELNEELALYRDNFQVDPRTIKVFWPPERVWETERLAGVLTDSRLLNGGYSHVLLDDRMFYSDGAEGPARTSFDNSEGWRLADFAPCRIGKGCGLVALPISRTLRWNIPPRDDECFPQLQQLLGELAKARKHDGRDVIAIYGDDLEKAAGIGGWGAEGPTQFEAFLWWMTLNTDIHPVKLSDWTSSHSVTEEKPLDVGTFIELSNDFGAGDNYEKWYFDPQWEIYRSYYEVSEAKVKARSALGADYALIQLAWKQLLVSTWETAWHTPSSGVHGDAVEYGQPSPWIKATASHARLAIVTAEAAYWMSHKDNQAHAYFSDIDEDGEQELILKNDKLFAVFTPRWGGRLVYLFNIDGRRGTMVIGNPCDDWNWMEELNRYMQIPANHPGALTDLGYEDDLHEATLDRADGTEVTAQLTNIQSQSPARGIRKILSLAAGSDELQVAYRIPENVPRLNIECGVSPDYLSLLYDGPYYLKECDEAGTWGYTNGGVSVWVRLESLESVAFESAQKREFGHGRAIRFRAPDPPFTFYIGTRVSARKKA